MTEEMFNLRLVRRKSNRATKKEDTTEENFVVNKIKNLISESKTYEQLNTTKKFIDLFLKNIEKSYIIEDINYRWLEKQKALKLG